ncbi:MAG TPA: hypothetical protein VFU86_19190 [Terriglobales bacterium]|nr:hypothetical protein [Terriglobales bacterium]
MKTTFVQRALSVFLVLASSLAGSTFAAAQSFDGFNRRINIVNDSPYPVMQLYASNVVTGVWQEDLLGQYILLPGGEIGGTIDDGSRYCHYDVKAVLFDGSELIRWNVDVCSASYLDITGSSILVV